MHEITKKVLEIEYPRQHETITSAGYSIRIAAMPGAKKVEVSIDGGAWEPCRQAEDAFWYDWFLFGSGEHELIARLPLANGQFLLTKPRLVTVQTTGERVHETRHAKPRRERHAETHAEIEELANMLVVAAPSRPEILLQLTKLMSQEGIDAGSILMETFGDVAFFRLMLEKKSGLGRLLEDEGFQVLEDKVFHLELRSGSNGLEQLTQELAEREISVRYLYGTTHDRTMKVVLSVDRPAEALRIVKELGHELVAAA